jgi:hypothetical protein
MFRNIIGFAIFAFLAWMGIMFMFSAFAVMLRIAGTVLWLAALGFMMYLVLRVVSPSTADKIRDVIRGRPADI